MEHEPIMTTVRDVIAEWARRDDVRLGSLPDGGYALADAILELILSAPESVRLELAAKLNPWRPISEAPKDGTKILTAIPWLPYAKPLFWAKYANDWRCPATENRDGPYEPTHWLPLPAPPSEDEL